MSADDEQREPFDRGLMIQVLIYHQRANASHCACGWSKLGFSHAEHIVDVYEASLRALGLNA